MNTIPNIEDLCLEMPLLNINIDHRIESNMDSSWEEKLGTNESDDDSQVYQVTPLYESVSSGDESHAFTMNPPKKHAPSSWEVSVDFALGYLCCGPNLLGVQRIDNSRCQKKKALLTENLLKICPFILHPN